MNYTGKLKKKEEGETVLRSFLKLFTTLLIITAAFAHADAQPVLADKIVGIVGDKIILRSDLEIQFQQYMQQAQGAELPPNAKCLILDQMISQKMFLSQALVDSVEVSEDEVEGELNRRIRYFISMIGSTEKLEQFYGKSVAELKEEFREDIREQLLSQKMQGMIFANVTVSPSEVKSFYKSIPEDSLPFFNAEVEVAQIVIRPKATRQQEMMAREKIEGLKQRIKDGEDFSTMALLYSEDPGTASAGGDLGMIERGEMVPEFEAAAFSLEPNGISDIVKTQYGFHLIQMLERRGNRVHVRHILVRPQTTSFDMNRAVEHLDSIRNLIESGTMTFEAAVAKFSDDETSKHNAGLILNQASGTSFFEMDQLDKQVYFAIDTLKPGQISQPTSYTTETGELAFRIIKLKSETEPHQANLKEDYHKIQAAALAEKKQKAMENWFNTNAVRTYIFVDEDYRKCEAVEKWFNNTTSRK